MSEVQHLSKPNERGQIARYDFKDGQEAAVVPQIFNALLTVGHTDDDSGYSQVYTYETTERARHALAEWAFKGSPEPEGWIRHIPSNRRREDGDPETEYVRP